MNLLIVVDAQKDFISGYLGTPEAVEVTGKIAYKIRKFTGDIIATLDTHNKKKYFESYEGKKLPIAHCMRMTEGWLINEVIRNELDQKENVKYIEKENFSATELIKKFPDYKCHMYRDNKVIFVGYCTDTCVISNALLLKSFYPEIEIEVDVSCCAGTTPEKHRAAIEVMKSCQITVVGEDYE